MSVELLAYLCTRLAVPGMSPDSKPTQLDPASWASYVIVIVCVSKTLIVSVYRNTPSLLSPPGHRRRRLTSSSHQVHGLRAHHTVRTQPACAGGKAHAMPSVSPTGTQKLRAL